MSILSKHKLEVPLPTIERMIDDYDRIHKRYNTLAFLSTTCPVKTTSDDIVVECPHVQVGTIVALNGKHKTFLTIRADHDETHDIQSIMKRVILMAIRIIEDNVMSIANGTRRSERDNLFLTCLLAFSNFDYDKEYGHVDVIEARDDFKSNLVEYLSSIRSALGAQ